MRGEVYVGGYIIEKIDENTTQISYFSDADLKGKIPGMIKNTVSSKQGEIASKVGIAMQKDGLWSYKIIYYLRMMISYFPMVDGSIVAGTDHPTILMQIYRTEHFIMSLNALNWLFLHQIIDI